MSLGMVVLFCVVLLFVILLFLSIRVQFDITHHQEWRVVCTVWFLRWRFPIDRSAEGSSGRAWPSQFMQHTSIEPDWSSVCVFA